MSQKQEWDTSDGDLIYSSKERGGCYNCIRWLWCGCCEDSHRITTKYVKVHRWDGCSQITDSMAMEAVQDTTKKQSCCCCMASCFCNCCIKDFGDVELYGNDESTVDGTLVLKNVAHCSQVHTTLTAHLQEIHKGFRQNGVNLGNMKNKMKILS